MLTLLSTVPRHARSVPVEVPHADRVPGSSVEHRACRVQSYLVDLTLALRKGYGAGRGAGTGVT